jgi:hypothetical protein
MGRYAKLLTTAALLGALAALSGPSGAAAAAKNLTAQSVSVQMSGAGDYLLTETETFQFNIGTASGYFTNLQTGAPAVSCTGGGSHGVNCASTNQPLTPTAPNPDPTKVTDNGNGQAFKDRCTFWNGGTPAGSTYTQSVTVLGLNGSGNWTFTWTYTIAATGTVAAQTAWDATFAGGTAVTITFGANIESQSVLVSSQYPTAKYSFSLVDSSGNRVQSLNFSVTDGTNTYTATPNSTVVVNYPWGTVDFISTGNGGEFGTGIGALLDAGPNSVPYQNSGATSGDALSILNGLLMSANGLYHDTFAGNNNGGADGSALAMAVMDSVQQTLGPGNYAATLTGVVKGNSTTVDQDFSITQTINIITPSYCTN